MRLLGLTIVLVLTFSSVALTDTMYVSYNGHVTIITQSKLVFLPFPNSSSIASNSTFTILPNGSLLFPSPGEHYISFTGHLPYPNVTITEPFQAQIFVVLPSNVQLKFVSDDIKGFMVNSSGTYLEFYGNEAALTYELEAAPINPELYLVPSLGVSVGITGYLAYLLFGRTQVKETSYDELDPRDTLVLKAVVEGADTLAKISETTGMPRTTAYRRIRKLVRLGYVEEIREGGKVRYIKARKS